MKSEKCLLLYDDNYDLMNAVKDNLEENVSNIIIEHNYIENYNFDQLDPG